MANGSPKIFCSISSRVKLIFWRYNTVQSKLILTGMENVIEKEARDILINIFDSFADSQKTGQRNLYLVHKSNLKKDTQDKYHYSNVHAVDYLRGLGAIFKYIRQYPVGNKKDYQYRTFHIRLDFDKAQEVLKKLTLSRIEVDEFGNKRPEILSDGTLLVEGKGKHKFTDLNGKQFKTLALLVKKIVVNKADLYGVVKNKVDLPYETAIEEHRKTRTHQKIKTVVGELNKLFKKKKIPLIIKAEVGKDGMRLSPTPVYSPSNKHK